MNWNIVVILRLESFIRLVLSCLLYTSTSSLSAILLNDDFYKFMMSGRRVVDGIGVLGAEHLIPFKMYANITPHI